MVLTVRDFKGEKNHTGLGDVPKLDAKKCGFIVQSEQNSTLMQPGDSLPMTCQQMIQ